MKIDLTTKEILCILDYMGHIYYDCKYNSGKKTYTNFTIAYKEYMKIELNVANKLRKAIGINKKSRK